MRLTKAEISGIGRLASGRVNLDNKVIAVVGPNEAGKSTLLKALAFVSNEASLTIPERSRGMHDSHRRKFLESWYRKHLPNWRALRDELNGAHLADEEWPR